MRVVCLSQPRQMKILHIVGYILQLPTSVPIIWYHHGYYPMFHIVDKRISHVACRDDGGRSRRPTCSHRQTDRLGSATQILVGQGSKGAPWTLIGAPKLESFSIDSFCRRNFRKYSFVMWQGRFVRALKHTVLHIQANRIFKKPFSKGAKFFRQGAPSET